MCRRVGASTTTLGRPILARPPLRDQPPCGAAPPDRRQPPATHYASRTDRELLTIDEPDPALKGYRCFLAISKRIREERGEFFLQPHRTSVVWGGQKALFIFEHQSGEVGLYYDVKMREPVAAGLGGGSAETCTILMKTQTFIPVPDELTPAFLPAGGETKRLEVRCDLLYMDPDRR